MQSAASLLPSFSLHSTPPLCSRRIYLSQQRCWEASYREVYPILALRLLFVNLAGKKKGTFDKLYRKGNQFISYLSVTLRPGRRISRRASKKATPQCPHFRACAEGKAGRRGRGVGGGAWAGVAIGYALPWFAHQEAPNRQVGG